MARIAGVNIPTNKRVVSRCNISTALGAKAKEIMEKVVPEARRVSQLTDQEVLQIREVIDRDYMVEGDLRREVANEHQAAHGSRLLSRVASSPRPAGSGPATHTNARTRKGPAKAIAGKKK